VGHIKLYEEFHHEFQKTNNFYHSTDIDAFYSIIFQNKLAGITPQEIEGKMVRGISCTRDKNFVYKNSDITLELSTSLTKQFKTYNVDFFSTNFGKERKLQHDLTEVDEKEIFIVTGDINSEKALSPLSKFLVSIRLNKKGMVLPNDIIEILEINYNKVRIYNSVGKDITKTIIKNKIGIGFDSDDLMGFNDFGL
jgi:hypothetical protein